MINTHSITAYLRSRTAILQFEMAAVTDQAEKEACSSELSLVHSLIDEVREPHNSDRLTGSEALYGFAGWLTTRKQKTILSSSDDAAPVADMVHRFCLVNHLAAPREGWEQELVPVEMYQNQKP